MSPCDVLSQAPFLSLCFFCGQYILNDALITFSLRMLSDDSHDNIEWTDKQAGTLTRPLYVVLD